MAENSTAPRVLTPEELAGRIDALLSGLNAQRMPDGKHFASDANAILAFAKWYSRLAERESGSAVGGAAARALLPLAEEMRSLIGNPLEVLAACPDMADVRVSGGGVLHVPSLCEALRKRGTSACLRLAEELDGDPEREMVGISPGTWTPGHPVDVEEWAGVLAARIADVRSGNATPLDLDELDRETRDDGARAAAPETTLTKPSRDGEGRT